MVGPFNPAPRRRRAAAEYSEGRVSQEREPLFRVALDAMTAGHQRVALV